MPTPPRTAQSNLEGLRIDPSLKRRRVPAILYVTPVVILIVAALGSQLVGSQSSDAPAPAAASTTATTKAPAGEPAPPAAGESLLKTTGYIVPRERIELSPRFQATVAQILVGKGDRVDANEVLVQLEDTEYRSRLAEAEARIASAEARLSELKNGARPEEIARARYNVEMAEARVRAADTVLTRRRDLVAQKSAPAESVDDAVRERDMAQAALNVARQELKLSEIGARAEAIAAAEAELALAKAARDSVKVYLDWCVIRSPIAGTVLTRDVDAGELVTPQSFGGSGGPSTSFLSMADLSDLQVQIDLNEQFTSKVFLNQLCEVRPAAFPDKKFVGYVFEIAPEANRSKGTLEVRVQVLNPDASLTPELTAQVQFLNATYEKAAEDRAKRKRRTGVGG